MADLSAQLDRSLASLEKIGDGDWTPQDSEHRALIAEARAAEARVEALEQALAEAAVVLEVLRGQIITKPYRELTEDFQASIIAACLIARAALSAGQKEGQ